MELSPLRVKRILGFWPAYPFDMYFKIIFHSIVCCVLKLVIVLNVLNFNVQKNTVLSRWKLISSFPYYLCDVHVITKAFLCLLVLVHIMVKKLNSWKLAWLKNFKCILISQRNSIDNLHVEFFLYAKPNITYDENNRFKKCFFHCKLDFKEKFQCTPKI